MSNFLSRSKDLYFNDKERFSYFQNVYGTIAELSLIKNTFHCDLHNIEEILSLLEMEAFMKGERLQDEFVRFLSDVIKSLLPPIEPVSGRAETGNWHHFIFGNNPMWKPYCEMVACMLNLEMRKANQGDPRLIWSRLPTRDKYAVVTLNYDMVLESAFSHVLGSFHAKSLVALEKKTYDPSWGKFQLAKLHGCAEEGNIIPPTWRKGSSEVIEAWKLAYNLIRDANQIRIVGYSLPVSDSYVRYLLKSAIRDSANLKNIDVIVYDSDASVEKRFREFIDLKTFRFKNVLFEALLTLLSRLLEDYPRRHGGIPSAMPFDQLEHAHQSLFAS